MIDQIIMRSVTNNNVDHAFEEEKEKGKKKKKIVRNKP